MTILAGTLQTDPRSGGIKRSSGVNVMPSIGEGMKNQRDNKADFMPSVDSLL